MPRATRSDEEQPTWADICQSYYDIMLGANRTYLTERWQTLVEAAEQGADRLEDWIELVHEIASRDTEEADNTRLPLARVVHGQPAELEDEVGNDGREYGCPTGQCARIDHEVAGLHPECDLRKRPMKPL